jgi:DUF1680 family protein
LFPTSRGISRFTALRKIHSGAAPAPAWKTTRNTATLFITHDADSLYVNLFIASELAWQEKGLRLSQETHFPEEDSTRLLLSCEQPVHMTLKIRNPMWAQGVQVSINGQKLDLDAGTWRLYQH